MSKTPKKYRSSTGGSRMLDRKITGVGRIHMASGLYREPQFRILNDGITELARDEKGRAILSALYAGSLPVLVLFEAIKANDFSALAVGGTARPLLAALESWRETHKPPAVAKRTYEVRAELITHLRGVVKPTTPIAALPESLRLLKGTMRGAPRSFNLDLQYASAFVRDTLGRRNPLYLDVRDIEPLKQTKATERNPLTPQEVLTLAATFDRVWATPRVGMGRDLIVMAMTGMGPSEYAGEWAVYAHHVHINGTKREGRDRDVPNLFPSALYAESTLPRPALSTSAFTRALMIARVASGIDCTPYDLRRTFGNWMEAAGIPRSRRRQYLGHAVGDVTERYERHEVTAYLVRDGLTLRNWIAASLANERPNEHGANSEDSPSIAPSDRRSDREVPLTDRPSFHR